MLKKFYNFALESNSFNVDEPDLFVRNLDVRSMYELNKNSEELICASLNKTLSGKEVRFQEMIFNKKKNLFFWNNMISKFLVFNHAGKYEDGYYIKFDNNCMIKLNPNIQIEYRLIIH